MNESNNKKRKLSFEQEETSPVASIIQERTKLENEQFFKLNEIVEKEGELRREENELRAAMSFLNLSDEKDVQSQSSATTEQESRLDKKMEHKLSSVINQQGSDNIVRLRVGHQLFMTTKQTIEKSDNVIKVMLNSDVPLDCDADGSIIFMDQNPSVFHYILEYMEFSGDVHKVIIDRDLDCSFLESLRDDAAFFGCIPLVHKVQFILNSKDAKKEEENPDQRNIMKQSEVVDDATQQQDLINRFESLLIVKRETGQQYFTSKHDALQQKSEDLLSRKASIARSGTPLELNLIVRGRSFTIPLSVLSQFPESLFFHLFSTCGNKEIFLDKDPDIVELLLRYMSTLKYDHFPRGYYQLKRVKRDARFYNLQDLCKTFFNKYRYPIETLGPRNIEMKAQEDLLRRLFAIDRNHPLLEDPYINLLPIFHLPTTDLQPDADTQSIPMLFNFDDVFSLKHYNPEHWRDYHRPKLVDSMDTFLQQWTAMTGKLLEGMNWANVFAAGGSVLASALQLPRSELPKQDQCDYADCTDSSDDDEEEDLSHTHLYYEKPCESSMTGSIRVPTPYQQMEEVLNRLYPTSDVDLFLYGLSEKEAEDKIEHIYQTIKRNLREQIPSDVTSSSFGVTGTGSGVNSGNDDVLVVRTKSAITFRSKFFRSFQIILRIYKSPAEVLIGFDIDSCCIGFDGRTVWALPRARRAIVNRMNLVDVDRQSTTFEIRLYKYAKRGFRVGVPGYHHEKVKNNSIKNLWSIGYDKPNLYNTHYGLARLLLLEKSLKNEKTTLTAIGLPRKLSNVTRAIRRPPFLTVENEFELDLSESDYASVTLSYFRNTAQLYHTLVTRCNAVRTVQREKLNDPAWNPSLVISLNDLTKILDNKDSDSNLSPKIEWITVEPGRQYIGSFNPTDRNFFKDAYSYSELQVHQKIEKMKDPNIRKRYAVKWYLRERRGRKLLNAEDTRRAETAYRKYQEAPESQRTTMGEVSISEGVIILRYMSLRHRHYGYHGVIREKYYVDFEYKDPNIAEEEEEEENEEEVDMAKPDPSYKPFSF